MPIATRSASDKADLEAKLAPIAGVSLQAKAARVYPLGPAAAQVIGYVSHPTADELRQRASTGLDEEDWIGRAGLEGWADESLGGAKGGAIHVVDQSGRVLRTIAQKSAAARPGLDRRAQRRRPAAGVRSSWRALGQRQWPPLGRLQLVRIAVRNLLLHRVSAAIDNISNNGTVRVFLTL